MKSIHVLDSHTGGEPTRLVLAGGPDLGTGPLEERALRFRKEFDAYRSAIVNEPRGSDVMVGALLVPPHRDGCDFGVIFFNNVGLLGMCGHGTIGLVVSLAHLGRIKPGRLKIDTPVGAVDAELHADGSVSFENVPSFRRAKNIDIDLSHTLSEEDLGGTVACRGDVAWGGNWFFIVEPAAGGAPFDDLKFLTGFTAMIRTEINAQGYPEVDHVEMSAPSEEPGVDSDNFVLCPGGAYDRSPCGTGTSAMLACLAADGTLAEGESYVVRSITGSRFTARYRWLDRAKGKIAPTITGTAHVMAEATLFLDERDPLCWGIRP